VSDLVELLTLEGKLGGGKGEERDDGLAGVTTDDGNVDGTIDSVGSDGVGTEDIKGGDTEELLRVVSTLLLEDLSPDGNHGVHRVGDDEERSVRASLGSSSSDVGVDTSVDVEEIVTSHAGLTGNTSGDDDDVSVLKGGREVLLTSIALDLNGSGDVGEINGNTGGDLGDIVEREGSAKAGVVELKKHGEGLADTTSSTNNTNADVALSSSEDVLLVESTSEHD
jgi:hypothetical protein